MKAKLIWNQSVVGEIDRKFGVALKGFADESVGQVVEQIRPISRTGRLADSIQASVEGVTATIGSDVEYAPVVELGGLKTPPRHVFLLGLQKASLKFAEIFKRAFGR